MIRIIFITILFLSSNVFANPRESVVQLMNEPVNLFDMGIYKLEESLRYKLNSDFQGKNPYDWADIHNQNLNLGYENILNGEKVDFTIFTEKNQFSDYELKILKEMRLNYGGPIIYKFNSNKILIPMSFRIDKSQEKSLKLNTDICLIIRRAASSLLNVRGNILYPEIFEKNKNNLTNYFSKLFGHEGYQTIKTSNKIFEDLIEIVEINVLVDTWDLDIKYDSDKRYIYCSGNLLTARPEIIRGGAQLSGDFYNQIDD